MNTIGLLQNTIQYYAWGSPTAIPDLLGLENPTGKPWAELWMGAHPMGPSRVNYEGGWISLLDLIRQHPHDILGRSASVKFHNTLPYLFKVLAAAAPLSVQVHPDLDQARAGFERENMQAIPLQAANRSYRDDNHKPECICALSKFYALQSFRTISEIEALMSTACPVGLADELNYLKSNPDSRGLKIFFSEIMTMTPSKRKQVIAEALQNIHKIPDQDSIFWIQRLSEQYPSDIGILSPLLLNLVCLLPGQALFLPAGELHAYLEGLGIELMANSDNVLRGGLTPKHIDLSELLKVVRFEPRPVSFLNTEKRGKNEKIFLSPAQEFFLSSISVTEENAYLSSTLRSTEILLCTNGEAWVQDIDRKKKIKVNKGISVIIPAAVKSYTIDGDAVFYKAAIPI